MHLNELVTIVIPTYNRADLLKEAILSAIQQTYEKREIIVVDDGSTDNTKDVCAQYGDKIRYIYKPNGGTGSALNLGITHMKGEWFKWLSSDDVLEKDAVEKLVRFANEKEAMFVYSDIVLIDYTGRTINVHMEQTYTDYYHFASQLWQYHIGNGSGSLIHHSIFDRVGRFREMRGREDYDFWLRACIIHGYMLYRCPEALVRYRVHEGTLTKKLRTEPLVMDEKIRQAVRRDFITMRGEAEWNNLLENFKRYPKVRPLWRRSARRLMQTMPRSFADFTFHVYRKFYQRTNQVG